MNGTIIQKNALDLSRVSAVLFDFDGTLMDTNDLIRHTWRYTVKSLTGREMTDDEIRLSLGEMLMDTVRRVMPEVDAEHAVTFYRDYQRGIYLDRIKLFEGAEDVLLALRAAGYRTALVTSRLKGSTERGLIHFGIYNLFDAVLTASDTDVFKPDPAPINIILERLGAGPDEAVYIGDAKQDIEAGIAAGVITVLVDWSLALPPEKRAECPAPDIIIKSLQEILILLGVRDAEEIS